MAANLNPKAVVFAKKLEAEIRRGGFVSSDGRLNKRAFGKAVDPADPERGRRRLQRHLSGRYFPSRASRNAYADTLGIPHEVFADPDDEEESEDMAATLQALARDQHALGRRIERALQKERA